MVYGQGEGSVVGSQDLWFTVYGFGVPMLLTRQGSGSHLLNICDQIRVRVRGGEGASTRGRVREGRS